MTSSPLIDPVLFEQIKSNLEQESNVKKEIGLIVDELEKNIGYAQGILSRVHSTPRDRYPTFLTQVEVAIKEEVVTVNKLATYASQYPYYKYNFRWVGKVQDAIATAIMCAWLGGIGHELGHLLTLEEIGTVFQVPVNLKDRDSFHITIEEYLAGLVSVIEDLSRLAMNSVTLGDNEMAVRISSFIKDLHAGFQLLNLKNDHLRKRVDSVKYSVKRVEDVIYDLSLRNLLPPKT